MAEDFTTVCTLDDLWPGEMGVFEVQGVKVLICHTEGGALTGVQLICPHQSFALSEGELVGEKLICTKHMHCISSKLRTRQIMFYYTS